MAQRQICTACNTDVSWTEWWNPCTNCGASLSEQRFEKRIETPGTQEYLLFNQNSEHRHKMQEMIDAHVRAYGPIRFPVSKEKTLEPNIFLGYN